MKQFQNQRNENKSQNKNAISCRRKERQSNQIIPPSILPWYAALTSIGCLSVCIPLEGVVVALLLSGGGKDQFAEGTLSYGLPPFSIGLFVAPLSTIGLELFLPRLALLKRSAARENRFESELSVSLRPRLWV